MVIDNSTLLQTNAAVIMGVLIFLTVGSDTLIGSDGSEEEEFIIDNDFFVVAIIVMMIFPFSVSSLTIMEISRRELGGKPFEEKDKKRLQKNAVSASSVGFLYLMIGIILIAGLRIFNF